MSLTYLKTCTFLCFSFGVIVLCLIVPTDTVYAKDSPNYARSVEDQYGDIGIHYCEDRLLVKISTSTQACVSIESGEKLVERGWGKYYEQSDIIFLATGSGFMSPLGRLMNGPIEDREVHDWIHSCTNEPTSTVSFCVLTFRNGTSIMYQPFWVTHHEKYMEYHAAIFMERCIRDYTMSNQTMSVYEFAEDSNPCEFITTVISSKYWPYDIESKIKNVTISK